MTPELQMVYHLDVYHVLYGHMAALRARDLFAPSLWHRSVLEDKKREETACLVYQQLFSVKSAKE